MRSSRRYSHLLLTVLLLLFTCASLAQVKGLVLPQQQQQWLQAHPVITLGMYDSGWIPFEDLRNGQPQGLGYDYLQAIAHSLGVRVELRIYPSLSDLLKAACHGDVNVVMNLSLTAERTQCLVFSRPYITAPVALAARQDDNRLATNPDLAGLRVVVERDFSTVEATRIRYPKAMYMLANNTSEALEMVADGRADVYLGNPYVITARINQGMVHGVVLVKQSDVPLFTLHFAVPNADQPLAEAIDLALASLPDAQTLAIRTRWLPTPQWKDEQHLTVTPAEADLLTKTLKLGYAPNWPPISFLDAHGEPSGLAAEYLRRFRIIGAHFDLVSVKDWGDIRERMHDDSIDAIMGLPIGTPVKGNTWVLSQPFLTVTNVIVTREGTGAVLDIHDVDQDRIALSDPDRLTPLVLAQAPKATIIRVNSALEGLALVNSRQADAYIGNLAVVTRIIQERYSGNLRIAAPTGISDQLTFAVRQPYAPLISVFNRMLSTVSPREREALRSDWLAVEYRPGIDWRATLKWLLPVLLVLLTAAVVSALGYWRLRREVNARRRVEQRLTEVTDNLPAVVYQARRAPDGTLSFPFIAGDMQSMFGLSVEQATHDERDLFMRVHPEDQPRIQAAVTQAAATFGQIAIDFRALSEQGWRWIRSRGQPHRSHDGELSWSGYWIDVTEALEQSEALVIAKAAAERAAAAKADFMATMSHEIRTPMSGVLGMLEVLAHSGLDSEQQHVLETIEDSAQMLRQIIDDILDFSKIEAGALALEATPIELRHIIDNVQLMLSAQAAAKQLHITSHIDAAVGAMHLADGIRLRQILFNVLSNAIKFTEHGGVTITLVLLENEPQAQRLRLSVADTGIGISAEQQERLFRPFSQAEMSTTRRYGGTGLGLSICQQLVHLMGGEIALESIPNEGTRVDVTLTLPLAADDSEAREAMRVSDKKQFNLAVAPMGRTDVRVLVVEDHPTNQTLMRWHMQQLGLAADVVGDGSAALVALHACKYDLVITDCRMPVMDGYTMTRELRREEEQAAKPRLPVIALSASAVTREAERCLEAGMDDFLVKPVTMIALRQAIARWLPTGHEDQTPEQPVAAIAVEASTADALDKQALLQRFGSSAVVSQIVESLVPTLHEDLDALRAAINRLDAPEASERLHRIIGGVGTIGATTLAQQARALMDAIEQSGTIPADETPATFLQIASTYVRQLDSLR